jgi:hypothetical protein
VYRAKLNEDGLTCMVPIAISTLSNIRSRRLMIMEYRDQWVTVNVNTLPYLWVHYQVFLSVNYHRITEPNLEYQFWLESSYFQNLCQRPLQVLHQVSNNLSEFVQHEPLIIIKMRGFGTEFLVISRNHAFTEQHWFKNIDLDENLVNRYQSELQRKTDAAIYDKVYAEIQEDKELFNYKKKGAIELLKLQADGFVEKQKKS